MRSIKGIIIGFLLILLGFAVTSYSLIAGGVLAAAQEIRPRLIFDHLLHKGLIVDLAGGDAGGKLGHADNSVGVRGGKTADVHGAFLPCVCS